MNINLKETKLYTIKDSEDFLQQLKKSNDKHEIRQYIFESEMRIWKEGSGYLHWLIKQGWIGRVKGYIERLEYEMESIENTLNDYFFDEDEEPVKRITPPVKDYPNTLEPYLK